jgi:hypothetical protein
MALVTHRTSRAAYLLSTLPFVFLWLLSHGHVEALWLLLPAALCLVQAIRPTRSIWVGVFGIYLVFTGIYGLVLLSDLMTLSGGGTPSVLLDTDDSIVFIALELAFIGLTAWLWIVRPKRTYDLTVNPFSDADRL